LAGIIPPAPVVIVGAPGVVYGVAATEDDAVPFPTALTARSSTEYEVPLVSGVDPLLDSALISQLSEDPPLLWQGVPKVPSEYHVDPPSVDQS
jgi:hypothetical protein